VALLFEDGGLSQSRKLSYEGTRKASQAMKPTRKLPQASSYVR